MPLKPSRLPSAALLHEMFSLTEDYRIISKISRTSRRAGEIADAHMRAGYRAIYVDGQIQSAHRVIWVMVHGREPNGYIDHINGDILDNRPENLREATHAQNMCNKKLYKSSTSGAKGIHRRKDNGMWRAYISLEGKRTNVGQFRSREEAEAALTSVRAKLHGKYARVA